MTFKFNFWPKLVGQHAVLSASKSQWLRYSAEKLSNTIDNKLAAMHGTRLHEWAAVTIKLGILQADTGQTLNTYINDAIRYRMQPEVLLRYSDNAFGTADAIGYRKERKYDNMVLRIHDLKTGIGKANAEQLMVYAAYFCLEYGISPHDIYIELRIYQNDYVQLWTPDPNEIEEIMAKTIESDAVIEAKKAGEFL